MSVKSTAGLTSHQRHQQLALRAAVLRQVTPLWKILDPQRLDQTLPGWLAAVGPVVQDGHKASGLVASVYVQAMRDAAGIAGVAPLAIAPALPAEQLVTSLTVTSVVAIRRALGAGQPIDKAMTQGLVASSGAATRLALQGGRQTVIGSVRADRHAHGWERVTSGSPCAFCAMLASRGAVYSEAGSDFEAHDHCSCTAEPVYGGTGEPTGKAAAWGQIYQDHAAGTRDQLNNFRRAYEGRV